MKWSKLRNWKEVINLLMVSNEFTYYNTQLILLPDLCDH